MRRLLSVVLIAVCATLVLAVPAGAGGPTSVLITDPSGGQATALYYTDRGYDDLDGYLTGGEPLEGQPGRLGEHALNVTWMVHDVNPWRTQQLYPDAQGGPVVVTYGSELTGDGAQVSWRRVADAQGLAALLDRVLPGASTPDVGAMVEAPATEPSASGGPEERPESAWFSLTGWRWAFPGVLVGAGLAALAFLAARRGTGDSEPRVLLTDVAPDRGAPARR